MVEMDSGPKLKADPHSRVPFTQCTRCAPSPVPCSEPFKTSSLHQDPFPVSHFRVSFLGKGWLAKRKEMQEVTPATISLLYQADFWVTSPCHVWCGSKEPYQ